MCQLPAKPGRAARYDYEYERNGTANLFMLFAPLEGWRLVEVICLVQDNLNTHKPASLYGALPPVEARRLVERFEWHYTPKHGSWLNMVETELSVVSTQCLDRRIPDKAMLTEETPAWEAERNKKHAKADWQFTTADAHTKLKRLYPSI